MTLIACADDRFGMMFAARRQSMDQTLRARMLELAGGQPICMTSYSARQFGDSPGIRVCDTFPESGKYFFAEDTAPERYLDRCSRVILYRWNRVYPADRYFPADLLLQRFRLTERSDFAGNSHDTITEEIYEKIQLPE